MNGKFPGWNARSGPKLIWHPGVPITYTQGMLGYPHRKTRD
jgi:hypothetical protein